MITKEEFIEAIDIIKDHYEKEEKLTKYLHEFFMDGHSVVGFGGRLVDKIIELLAKNISEKYWKTIFNDIEYFMYNCNFGGNPNTISIKKDTTTKDYYLDSSSKLYDYIIDYIIDYLGG